MSEKYARLRDVLLKHADDIVCKVVGRIFDQDLDPVEARELAREIYSDNPWKLEVALYDIGREYCCPPKDPEWCYCEDCPVGKEDECEDYSRYKAKEDADKQERTENILDDNKFWEHVKVLEGKPVFTLVRHLPNKVVKVDESKVIIENRDSHVYFGGDTGLYNPR